MDNTNIIYGCISIFGKENAGKCTLCKNICIKYGRIDKPNLFNIDNIYYKILPIPCVGNDFNDNYEMSILNGKSCFVIIDINSTIDDYYIELIGQIYKNGFYNVIFIYSKPDICDNTDKCITILTEHINNIISMYNTFYNKTKIIFDYICINLNDDNQYNIIVDKIKNFNNGYISNNTKSDFKFITYDNYIDEEQSDLVISGKYLSGNISNIKDLKVIGNSINILPYKISDCYGNYYNSLNDNIILLNNFITMKIKNEPIYKELSFNNTLITNNNELLPYFDIFEAEILFINNSIPIITKGFYGIYNNYTLSQECSIEKVYGYYNNNNQFIQSNIIKANKGLIAKVIIKCKSPIYKNKYEIDINLGSFSLSKDNKYIAYGKIIKYKKYNK